MNGRKPVTSGSRMATSGTGPLPRAAERSVVRAWESFASGAVSVVGVRPEILASWHRCRDNYGVDPDLCLAPGATDHDEHHLEQDVIFTELGGAAACAAREVELDGGIVAVTDGTGRVLGSWGDPAARSRAADSNLAPWAAWSESSSGTNGMGTALESDGPVTVVGPEHWCTGFHKLTCAGVAIRNPVTRTPIAALNVSRWSGQLPSQVPQWLGTVARKLESDMRDRAIIEGRHIVDAFTDAGARHREPVAGLDVGGRIVIADSAARALLGVTEERPMLDPADRPLPASSALPDVVRWAASRARRDSRWSGSAQLVLSVAAGPLPVSLRPVFAANRLLGVLCYFQSQDGEPYAADTGAVTRPAPRPVIGERNGRLILLSPADIRFAEADRNVVWLVTDRGRIRAAARGLDKIMSALEQHGFARVHRRFAVNLRRVQEIERGIKGELFLITDARDTELVPVSRRHAPGLRQQFGV